MYTIGPYSDPVLQIEPGDRVVVETVDTFEGRSGPNEISRLINSAPLFSIRNAVHRTSKKEFFVRFGLRNSEGYFNFPNQRATCSLPPRAEVSTA